MLQLGASIAWTHHENYDGSGYPRGLAGTQIPIEGRIVAIADVYDALSNDRVYRPAFPQAQVREMVGADRGLHFDPDLVDLFLAEVLEVETSTTALDPYLETAPMGAGIFGELGLTDGGPTWAPRGAG